MRVVIQRVSRAEVKVNEKICGKIAKGFMVLLGVEEHDTEEDVTWLSNKIVNQRLFPDLDNKMNLSIKAIDGEVLLISQFTLYASTKKGNRPSFTKAAKPEKAKFLYQKMINQLSQDLGKKIETGVFGEDMKVSLVNDGPVTIMMDSRNRE